MPTAVRQNQVNFELTTKDINEETDPVNAHSELCVSSVRRPANSRAAAVDGASDVGANSTGIGGRGMNDVGYVCPFCNRKMSTREQCTEHMGQCWGQVWTERELLHGGCWLTWPLDVRVSGVDIGL